MPSTKDEDFDKQLDEVLTAHNVYFWKQMGREVKLDDATLREGFKNALKTLITRFGIDSRIEQMEDTKYAIMRGEYGHSEVAIVKEFDERIAELTTLRYTQGEKVI